MALQSPYNPNYTQNIQPLNEEQQPLQQIIYVDQCGNPINPSQETQVIQLVEQRQQPTIQLSTTTKTNPTDIDVATFCCLPCNPHVSKCCKVWCVAMNSLFVTLGGFLMLIAGFMAVIDPSPTCSADDLYDCDSDIWSNTCDLYGCSECFRSSSSYYGSGCASYDGDSTIGGILLIVFAALFLLFALVTFAIMKKQYDALKSGESTLPTQT